MKISPSKLTGRIEIVSSKSLSHRYLLAASLAEGISQIDNILESDDLVATQKALRSLGIKINYNQVSGGKLRVINNIIDCNESGTTLRFLVPIVMLTNEEVTFIGKGRLLSRPLSVYEELFNNQYYFKHLSNEKLVVKGKLKSGEYLIDGSVSSQFISGLLFALPLIDGDSKLILKNSLESKPYVNLTIEILNKFGIKINEIDTGYEVKGNQVYQAGQFTVEGDYSQAAFWIVAATLNDQITIDNLDPNSSQGDKEILEILTKMGGKYKFNDQSLIVYQSETKGITIDLAHIPDLGPILMILASLSKGKTTFLNVNRLKIKESDRLLAMKDALIRLGVKIKLMENQAVITGQPELVGDVELSTYGDHRIAMALAIAATRTKGYIKLDDASVINKSYPTFFKDYQKLGGKCDE